ncbi:MAG: hypothetical protein IPM52_01655 [Bacteroidetes bacterium]|nr:hypothetical protein [Bacteroidota bacterium]
MENKRPVIEAQTLRRVVFMFWFMFSATSILLATAVALASSESIHWLPDFLGFILLVVAVVFAIGGFAGTRLIAGHIFSRPEVFRNAAKLNESFVSWVMIRLALTTMACLFSSVGYMLTSNLFLLIVALLMLGLMAHNRPTRQQADQLLGKAGKSSPVK